MTTTILLLIHSCMFVSEYVHIHDSEITSAAMRMSLAHLNRSLPNGWGIQTELVDYIFSPIGNITCTLFLSSPQLDNRQLRCWNFRFVLFLFESYWRPCSAHAGHIGTDRSLLMGYDAILLRHIARDLLHVLSHRHDNTWNGLWWTSHRHWWRQVDYMLIEFHLSETNRPCRARTCMPHLTDGDWNITFYYMPKWRN